MITHVIFARQKTTPNFLVFGESTDFKQEKITR